MNGPQPGPPRVVDGVEPSDRPVEPPVAEVPAGPEQPDGERGGPKGPEPTRFGDWEKNGRCYDF